MGTLKKIEEDIKNIQSIPLKVDDVITQSDSDTIHLYLTRILHNIREQEKIQNYTKDASPEKKTVISKEDLKKEMVNHPLHYQGSKYECIDVMIDVFGKEKVSAFCELNAFKYQWRANNKGTNIQDKEKAIWYNQKYIDLNKK